MCREVTRFDRSYDYFGDLCREALEDGDLNQLLFIDLKIITWNEYDADPDGDCCDFIVNEDETAKQIDGFSSQNEWNRFKLRGERLQLMIAYEIMEPKSTDARSIINFT